MATDLAPVTPAILRWARESIGVSVADAAARAGVPDDRLLSWEAGEAEPTVAKLRSLARLYQRPLSIFFLPEPPRTYDTMRDFRRLPGVDDHSWSRALHKVYRRAVDQQEISSELAEADGEEVELAVPSASVDDDPEVAGEHARQALNVPLDKQHAWRKPEDSFAGWMRAVEALDIMVLRTSDVSLKEMRGFSLSGGPRPVIVVNALDWPRGQVFTLIHEFAHLMLRQGGLCDLLEPTGAKVRAVERWCNATAGAILLPASSLLTNSIVRDSGFREWDDDELLQISERWGVSREAVLRRFVELDRATFDYYLRKRSEYLAAYEEMREIEKQRRASKKSGGPPPHRMTIRDRGRPYVRQVLDAYHRDIITASSLSNILNLKLKHLPALEREVER